MTLQRPWLVHLGPLSVSYDGRQELAALAHGLTAGEFVDKCWDARASAAPPVKRPRSKSWPKTRRLPNGGPFVSAPVRKSNVSTLPKRSHQK